jgi:hypothetical protein
MIVHDVGAGNELKTAEVLTSCYQLLPAASENRLNCRLPPPTATTPPPAAPAPASAIPASPHGAGKCVDEVVRNCGAGSTQGLREHAHLDAGIGEAKHHQASAAPCDDSAGNGSAPPATPGIGSAPSRRSS